MLRDYVNLSLRRTDLLLPIQGEAGVGKTRMVYEALNMPGMENLVIYTNDEHFALEIAGALANDRTLYGILVVDECSLNTRAKLIDLTRGYPNRIRIVAIDNAGERPIAGAPEIWIQKIPKELLGEILKQNFPYVPEDRRHAYVSLSGGFVRPAADMCAHHAEIDQVGHVGPVIQDLRDYMRRRLSDDELIVIEALALVTRIGFAGEMAGELKDLCSIVNIPTEKVISL